MRSLISGQAAAAVVLTGNDAWLHTIESFDQPARIPPESVLHIFADATDVIELDSIDPDVLKAELQLLWEKDRALHLTLIAIGDNCEDDERVRAAKAADKLLESAVVSRFVSGRLHRAPLPDADAVARLVTVISRQETTHIVALLSDVLQAQSVIQRFHSEWQKHEFVGTAREKLIIRRHIEKNGVWEDMIRLRLTHQWYDIVVACSDDPVLHKYESVIASSLPSLMETCRGIYVAWPARKQSRSSVSVVPSRRALVDFLSSKLGEQPSPKVSRLKTRLAEDDFLQLMRCLGTVRPSYSSRYETEQWLLDPLSVDEGESDELDHVLLRDSEKALLLSHYWSNRGQDAIERPAKWYGRDSTPRPLGHWLERLSTVTDKCPLHRSGWNLRDFPEQRGLIFGRRGVGKMKLTAHRDLKASDIVIVGHHALRDPLAHAWHVSPDYRVTHLDDIDGLRWIETIISALPGSDPAAACEILTHERAVRGLLLGKPKTHWEWAASHAVRVAALRMEHFDLIERVEAPCVVSAHAAALSRLRRRQWEAGLQSLGSTSDPIADVLRIHAYGALKDKQQAREAFDRAAIAPAPALSIAREALFGRFLGRKGDFISDQYLFDRECDMLAEAA